MKKTLLPYLLIFSLFAACNKDSLDKIEPQPILEACVPQTAKPTGISYAKDSLVAYNCTSKHCGILPLSTRNYWVYEDSIFASGIFVKVQFDTLRYSTWKSLPDGLVWWESNISVGLPTRLYGNDSALYKLQERMFTPGFVDAKKEYGLIPGDSLRYLSNFDDVAAHGRSLKLTSTIKCPAGSYTDCMYFEKNARNYRKDQVFFKPGVGVIKYIREDAEPGSPTLKTKQISTLVAYHID